jgi:hypothetical protein
MSIPHRSLATLIGVAGLVIASAVLASGAMATPPTSSQHTFTGGGTIPADALCSFPVLLEGTQTWTSTQFYDQNGMITTDTALGFEQDTFSTNGKTLVGNPYHFALTVNFVDGVAVDAHGAGVAEQVPLPGGGVYIVAGRVDTFNANAAILTVDSGNSGNNVAAFCAALS